MANMTMLIACSSPWITEDNGVKKRVVFSTKIGYEPYVTHVQFMNKEGVKEDFWGHYFRDPTKAFADFMKRVQELV